MKIQATSVRRVSSLLLSSLLAWGAAGCGVDPVQRDSRPAGPVAENAEQAWPNKPDVPAINEEQIARTCVALGACAPADTMGNCVDSGECQPGEGPFTRSQLLILTELCISDMVHSAERAIPISGFNERNERVEWLADCVLRAPTDCGSVNSCLSERDKSIGCQEDGCFSVGNEVTTSCSGNIATITVDSRTFTRDCSRAFAECDPASETGCSDRHFSACPADISRADRCDGDIRLGCDGSDQVSYHDCRRMGGACATESDGSQGCVYPDRDAECQQDRPEAAACSGTTLSVCVNGKRLSFDSPEVCSK